MEFIRDGMGFTDVAQETGENGTDAFQHNVTEFGGLNTNRTWAIGTYAQTMIAIWFVPGILGKNIFKKNDV